ncbi:hypothetical protein O3P69_010400 [Scylla paramamosain]|uniref:Uncharacterized protein n=1 Tax=Scylla paramamosain TaxID=85552 RepID=A0AAW0TU49_SCYPA
MLSSYNDTSSTMLKYGKYFSPALGLVASGRCEVEAVHTHILLAHIAAVTTMGHSTAHVTSSRQISQCLLHHLKSSGERPNERTVSWRCCLQRLGVVCRFATVGGQYVQIERTYESVVTGLWAGSIQCVVWP